MTATDTLLSILDLESVEHNLFRGSQHLSGWQRIFGGQVIAQALMAANRTVEDRIVHSLHGYFMRPGDPSVPILYEVDRIHEGRSFATRRVVAKQRDHAIFTMAASFQVEETGFDHQVGMPDVPAPEDLPDERALEDLLVGHVQDNIRRYWNRKSALELRPVDLTHFISREKLPPIQQTWMRIRHPLPSDPGLHRAILAYASDVTILDTALVTHGRGIFDRDVQAASLDHAMWFHRPFRADEWLLYTIESPSTSGARGLACGSIFDREGVLVASVAQEGLIRLKAPQA